MSLKVGVLILSIVMGVMTYARQVSTTASLKELSADKLLACFDDWQICRADSWDIADELSSRGNISPLVDRYWMEHNKFIRNGIERTAYRVTSPEVTKFMRKVVAMKVDDGESRYYPIDYLAKTCDSDALRALSTGHFRNQGSLQYQTSVELFGKCKYRNAIPYLVEEAIHDVSFNIVIAAEHSLQSLYPDAPTDFESLGEMQKYYCHRARKERFHVQCGEDD